LIARIQQGDAEAFESLFHQYQPALFRFLWHFLRSEEAANDLIQNIFLKIWQNRATWKPGKSVSAYLYRAAKNAALNYIRDTKADRFQPVSENTLSEEQPDRNLEEQETLASVQKCIDALPDGCRAVFIMSRYEDAKYREISEALQISIKTVENQMGRALRLLRQCLKRLLA